MNRNDYLSTLSRLLGTLAEEDKREILYDYEEHFRNGMAEGKSEEEISASLGDVRVIARQFVADFSVKRAETDTSAGNIFRAVLATVALGFFNLIFVLGPFLGLAGVLIGLFAAGIGIVIGGVGGILTVIAAPIFPSFVSLDVDATFVVFASIGIICFGLLFLIGCCYLARFFFKGIIKYLKWNIETIRK